MSYTVLARKYRPQTFADLVGQEHVTRALGNAIASGRVAHAFLFTGVRGVGKTTSARILAKALNCERGPSADPCNVCDACVQITQGTDLDVLEIDGASNNSVEDVRRLQESIPFRPARGRFKIVIVDEVHMLSTGAFNAFLKTLEEPPAHVKFIFATTESHKVPVTIRSRCQRYDFRLIPQPVIVARLRQILQAEQIEADEEAYAIVAREAAGSMRDALTLLDQVVAFSSSTLLGREVSEKLGIADREHLYQLAKAVLTGDGKSGLEVVNRVATQGLDLLHFTRQWLDLTRDMVVLEVAHDKPHLVELSAEEQKRAGELAKTASLLELQRVFAGVAKLVDEVGTASTPRTILEMGVVRLATRPKLEELAQLIARVEQLAQREPAQAAAPRPTQNAPAREAARPAASASDTRGPAREQNQPAPAVGGLRTTPSPADNPFQRFVPPESRESSKAETRMVARDPVAETASVRSPLPPGEGCAQGEPSGAASAAVARSFAHHQGLVAVSAEPERVAALVPAALAAPDEFGSHAEARASTSSAQAEPRAASQVPPAQAAHTSAWPTVVERLRSLEPRWAAMYEHGVPSEVGSARVVVVFPEGSFFGRQAQTAGGSEALRRAASDVFGAAPEIVIKLATEVRGQSLAQTQALQLDERKEGIKKRALNHPRVLEALKVFPELAQKHDVQVD
jgi:DNA polymerase III subunit gamma/tau